MDLPLASCQFRGHEGKTMTKETDFGHSKTEVHEGFIFEAMKLVRERSVAVVQAARDLDLAESVLRRPMR